MVAVCALNLVLELKIMFFVSVIPSQYVLDTEKFMVHL